MGQPPAAQTYYAILIGINFYPAPEQPLEGSVNDVEAAKDLFEKRHHPARIQTFTAKQQDDPTSDTPAGDPKLWPTFENVTASFTATAAALKSGDGVYIHFSGHGTRMTPAQESANDATGDLALNLLTTDGKGIRYLRGLEFAYFLRDMVASGLIVTVVLDCCFSGSVLRHRNESGIREAPYNPEVDIEYPANPDRCLGLEFGSQAYRDASSLPNWLIKPEGYTILTACGPHEIACERKLSKGGKRGVFSYFLHRKISEMNDEGMQHHDVYRTICARMKEAGIRQSPMLFGNRYLGFLGDSSSLTRALSAPTVVRSNDGIRLQVGRAHGVSAGDLFFLQPIELSRVQTLEAQNILDARVSEVGNLTSTLELPQSLGKVERVKSGWTAQPTTCSLLGRFPILVASTVSRKAELLQCLSSRGLAHADSSGDHACLYFLTVTVEQDGNFYILDERSRRVQNIAPIHAQSEGSIIRLVEILEHLTKFRLFRELANPGPFCDSFSVRLCASSGETYAPGSSLTVTSGDTVVLQFENLSTRPLYVHPYVMGPLWQVHHILNTEYENVPPRDFAQGYTAKLRRRLKMTVPDILVMTGQMECVDILKVFVTARQTSFLSLELPKVEVALEEKKLKSLPSRLSVTASSVEASEDWAALIFVIRTRLRSA